MLKTPKGPNTIRSAPDRQRWSGISSKETIHSVERGSECANVIKWANDTQDSQH